MDFANSRVPMADLAGPWRFHAGDNPAWANPAFDDSGWSLLSADRGWSQQGYAGYGGFAWYRLAIQLPAQHGPLALYIPNVDVSCQVFANGRLIGQVGGLPPQPRLVRENRTLFEIPVDTAASGRLLLALRIWSPPQFAQYIPGGLYPAPRLGDAPAIAEWRRLQGREVYWGSSFLIVEWFANSIAALASLILFALRRKEREYLWFGIYLLNWSVWNTLSLYSTFRTASFYFTQLGSELLIGLGMYFGVEFYRTLCGRTRNSIYAAAAFFALATGCLTIVALLRIAFGSNRIAYWTYAGLLVCLAPMVYRAWRSKSRDAAAILFPLLWILAGLFQVIRGSNLSTYWGFAGSSVCVAVMVYRAWRSGNRDAGVLLIPLALGAALHFLLAVASSTDFTHRGWAQTFILFFQRGGIRWPFPYATASLFGDLTNLVVLIVLLRRYARTRRDEERLESELEAARSVQKVLIPDEVPSIPGFRIQAVYHPASQVGGDFFQIVAAENGAALFVIGDVSGKGMPAAMTVSLLVGAFRTLAHYTQSPAEILRAMNQHMLTRSDGGFTTCLVLRIDRAGRAAAANAGHLPPYLAGREISVDYGLPLGLAADSRYVESRFQLRPGEPLTLLTDGVPEARNARRELFGFESTAAISTGSAETIAEAARAFGQHDDVTVVKLTLEPAPILESPASAASGEPARR